MTDEIKSFSEWLQEEAPANNTSGVDMTPHIKRKKKKRKDEKRGEEEETT